MLRKQLAGLACVGLATVAGWGTVEIAQAQDGKPAAAAPKEAGKNVADGEDVAFPTLPKGAGKMDDNAPKKFTTTESGLKYRVLRAGSDPKPTARQSVEVHYHGWLDNKKVFDSSYERGETISFGLNQVIAGWTEGMQKVGKGGMIELEIPAKLGYGSRGAGAAVPPNATLHFLVELKDIK
jgi:FKBP-type peptidyl-prolyl cis-trans isomerase FkpA